MISIEIDKKLQKEFAIVYEKAVSKSFKDRKRKEHEAYLKHKNFVIRW